MQDPPGIAAFLTRVSTMDRAELTEYRNVTRDRYETLCRDTCDDPFIETGEKLTVSTALDRIHAINALCEYFWLTNAKDMRVAECLERVAALANSTSSCVH